MRMVITNDIQFSFARILLSPQNVLGQYQHAIVPGFFLARIFKCKGFDHSLDAVLKIEMTYQHPPAFMRIVLLGMSTDRLDILFVNSNHAFSTSSYLFLCISASLREILLRRRNGNLATFCRDKCLLDIRRNIAHVFNTNRNSDQPFSYPQPCSPPWRKLSMRRGRRMNDARE